MRNIRLVLEYDGANYHGWQVQPNGATVQEVLEGKLAIITQEKVRVTGSGRTDAGAHALGQVANFRTSSRIGTEELKRGLNSLLPDDIIVRRVDEADSEFHSRYSARSKTYRYLILDAPLMSPFYRNHAWHVRMPLSVERMSHALAILRGTHDFSSFRSASCAAKSPVRTIMAASLWKRGEIIEITVEADGFLQHMMRTIVGTLVELERRDAGAEEMRRILEAKDRAAAGPTAPARGLYLVEVKY